MYTTKSHRHNHTWHLCWKPLSLNFCQTVCTRSENTSEPPPTHIRTTSEPRPNHIRAASETIAEVKRKVISCRHLRRHANLCCLRTLLKCMEQSILLTCLWEHLRPGNCCPSHYPERPTITNQGRANHEVHIVNWNTRILGGWKFLIHRLHFTV